VSRVHSGPPLLTIIDELPRVDRNYTQPLRLPIAEKYKVQVDARQKICGPLIAF